MNTQSAIGLALAGILLGACGGTQSHRVAKEEMSSESRGATYKNLLVVGVFSDRATRVGAEDAFAAELTARGVKASPSSNIIRSLNDLASEAAVRSALSRTHHDGVLTVTTVRELEEYTYDDALETRGMVFLISGRTSAGPGESLGNLIEWADSGTYSLHVALWDAKTQKPVWQVTTDSTASDSAATDRKALADFVLARLRSHGLVAGSSK